MHVDIFRFPGLELRRKCLCKGVCGYAAKARRVKTHGCYCYDRKKPLFEFNDGFPKVRTTTTCERAATVERATPTTEMENCGQKQFISPAYDPIQLQ